MATSFVNRERELADMARFWRSRRAQCIPVTGRRRVGKTFLLEQFAAGKRCVYYRCQLKETADQLPQLGKALADMAEDAVLRVQPPATWPAVFATIERLTQSGRLLLVLDEIPYWVARDDSLPSILQNWWDERGRHLDIMLVLCGSAVEMMEKLLTGEAPLAGCVTGRVAVRPFDFRAAAEMLKFDDAVDSLTAYGVLGGVPLYLSFFQPGASPSRECAGRHRLAFRACTSSRKRSSPLTTRPSMLSRRSPYCGLSPKEGTNGRKS